MSELLTRLHFHQDDVTVERVQDVEDILDSNKILRGMPQKSDWGRHTWRAPNVIYEKLFNEYNAGRSKPDLRIFGAEFSEYANKRIMSDPDLRKLRTDDPSNPFFMGYRK